MSFLDNYLQARAQRTNPAYAAQMMAEQKRGYDLEDVASNRQYMENVMGQQAVPGQDAVQEPMGGLFDQALFQDDGTGAPQPTMPYVPGQGAPAQWNDAQTQGQVAGGGLMGAGMPELPSVDELTADPGVGMSGQMITTQEAVAPQAGTGIFGSDQDKLEAMWRTMGSNFADVRGYGGGMVRDQFKPTTPVKPSAFSEKMAFINSPAGKAAGMTPMDAMGGQTINVGGKLRGVADQVKYDDQIAMHKAARGRVEDARGQASAATRGIADLEDTLDLVNAVETGTGEESLLAARKLAKTFGFDVDVENIAQSEALQVKLGDFVMARVAETKGAVSEREMQLFQDYSAAYGKTQAGNRKILEFKNAKYKRDIAIGRMITKMQKGGKSSYDIDLAMDKYVAEHSLSGLLETKGVESTVPSQSAARAELKRRKKLEKK